MTYTRDEIMQMSADELRVAIAKKRGYPYPYDKYRVPVSKPIMLDAPYDAQPIPDFRVELRDVPDYLNDIAAAWELVEEMARNGMLVTFQISRNVVSILVNTPIFDGSETIRVNDNSASTTISRAWLIWSEEMGK